MRLIQTDSSTRTRQRPAVSVLAVFLGSLLLVVPSPTAFGQLPRTRLYAVSPAGAKVGTTVDVTMANGADLDEVDKLHFSHPGIKAVQKMQGPEGKQTPVANVFTVTVDAGVPQGLYDVRVSGLFGISNPRTFAVGSRDELQETEANNTPETATAIELDKVINGVIGGGTDVDYFKFTGKKDQRILATCRASRIDSRLEAKLELYAADGSRLAEGRNDVRRDPLVDLRLPADGDYYIKLHDYLFRGGAEYFYRLSVGTAPHIDYVVPPSGLPGSTAQYTVYGRNLPGGQPAGLALEGSPLEKLTVEIKLPDDPTSLTGNDHRTSIEADVEGLQYVIESPQGPSNPIRIAFATAPLTLEHEPNNEPAQAHRLTVPAEYAGQFQEKGDSDLVQFEAKAGDVYYIEVFGQRNGSSVDPFFAVDQVSLNDKGEETLKRITLQDDNASNLAANIFDTATDDPVYRFQAPANGTYRVTLRDRYFESRGNPSLVYRLSIRKPQPDFRLVAFPFTPAAGNKRQNATWSLGLRKGGNEALEVIAFRRDGFNGAIEVVADGLPEGVVCHPARIDPGTNNTTLVFTAAENSSEFAGQIRVIGNGLYEDTAKTQALAAAKAAVVPVAAAMVKLDVLVRTSAEATKATAESLTKAKEAAAANKEDANLTKAVAEAQKTADAAAQAAKVAVEAQMAGAKKLAELNAAVDKAEAERVAAIKTVSRDAQAGSVVWTAPENIPAISRVARSLALAVLKEPEPFQVTTEPVRLEVNQGRQILLPVKLIKRTGFDADVALTLNGIPKNANIDIQNKPIKKGADSELLRLFVKNNAPLKTYTTYLNSEATVSYRRNIFKLQRAQAEQAEVAKVVASAAEGVKATTATRDAAKTKADADAAVLKERTDKRTAAEQAFAAADAAAKAAVAAKPEKEIAAAQAAQEASKKSAEKLAAIQKTLTEAEGEIQKKLEEALAASTGVAAELAAARKNLTDVTAAADKQIADTAAAAKAANDNLVAAQKAVAEVEPTAKASQEALAKAESELKSATDQSNAAIAAKTAVDKKVADAEKATKAANVAIFPPSTPVLITVKPSPATLAAAVPSGGALKQGGKIDVKVTVTRTNGYSGPVKLTLPIPPGVTGLSAAEVTIPAESNEGVIAIVAAADTPEGQPANLVIRGTMKFEGDAAVDIPVTLKVAK